jgi:prepilin-type N-terminal cleavage/methylation domain-containing protein
MKAFTLVELIIVLVIIGLVAAIGYPVLIKHGLRLKLKANEPLLCSCNSQDGAY